MLNISEIGTPLAYDHEIHVSKQHQQQNDLRDEFKEEVELVIIVESVEGFHADTQ